MCMVWGRGLTEYFKPHRMKLEVPGFESHIHYLPIVWLTVKGG